MTRDPANDDDVRAITGRIWAHVGGTNWTDSAFDWRKAAVSAGFSKLAYLAIPNIEFEERGRFKLVPCKKYLELIAARRSLLTQATLGAADFASPFIIPGELTVTVVARMRDVVFVAVRGTSKLYESSAAYDWRVNLTAIPKPINNSVWLHRGFAKAAFDNIGTIYEKIAVAVGTDKDVQVYVAGHSLGGAVAAILANVFTGHFTPPKFECPVCGELECDLGLRLLLPSVHPEWSLNSAYTFGMPHFGNIKAVKDIGHSPYHVLHLNDVVPTVPPWFLGYANGQDEHPLPIVDYGNRPKADVPFWKYAKGLPGRLSGYDRIMWYHCIENYWSGMDEIIK